ncbi:MAG: F0F1 ATP synthase subunit alpha [Ruminococcaceae bacterium]|jgi:F-type H+-transporting ATPase subunit alpha|nr:F0F1 ATP synthase subunit alpha [Oscillospiraceae bacterium]
MNNNLTENISSYLKRIIDEYEVKPISYRYGSVEKLGDGVVRVANLPDCCYGELLEFESGAYGMVLDLEENRVGAVLLEKSNLVRVGETVKGTGRVVRVPVGDCCLGRVLDPIGRTFDGEELKASEYYPVERPAPKLIDRRPVDTPLQTGFISIDSMIPIGRGQRELIIGDRQTGKTSIGIDTIINQKGQNVICIYCAIGQKASTVAGVIKTLRDNDAMDYSIVVSATAADSPAMQYLAPYSACAIGEYFMEHGKDVLIVYDDLSKHAIAYRTMSLLLHRPPGREAYPGDVFYLHSRLLERAACLSKEKGGGTLTALPIIETMGGNISAYIPTNVISITDGQIYLESELFHSGVRPAVNTGLSVSRVGRSAQREAMKKVSGSLRIELAQYREMAVFARFGADIDDTTKALLERGEHLTALFNQGRLDTYSLSEMVIMLYAFNKKAFAGVENSQLDEKSHELYEFVKKNYPAAVKNIETTYDLDDSTKETLKKAIKEWVAL